MSVVAGDAPRALPYCSQCFNVYAIQTADVLVRQYSLLHSTSSPRSSRSFSRSSRPRTVPRPPWVAELNGAHRPEPHSLGMRHGWAMHAKVECESGASAPAGDTPHRFAPASRQRRFLMPTRRLPRACLGPHG